MLITAPARIDIEGPLVFVAGPIIRGPDAWHDRAVALLAAGQVHVANPCRDVAASALLWNRREDNLANPDRDFPEADYNAQVDWETHYLRRAATNGAVLFWLAREREHSCERPHGQTTRFELAEWKERHARDGVNLVVGIEDGFTGARYVRRRFAQDCPRVRLCDSLEETCRVAVELCVSSTAS
jgi:hypothetical protein